MAYFLSSAVRLRNGPNRCSGQIEVFQNSQWGTVCESEWDSHDAQVVCRELNCGDAVNASGRARYSHGSGPIWLEGFNCTGKEASLRECPQSPWREHSCNHNQDASVECSWRLRLVNGSSRCSGRVEVFHNQHWEAICEHDWDLDKAHVVCREVDCGEALSATGGSYFGSGSGHIRLHLGYCEGQDTAFFDCELRDRGDQSCASKGAAGVICSELRLVNGPHRCSGRIEVLHNELWGTVCGAGWDTQNAEVVCRQLGCGNVVKISNGALFGQGSGPIWLERVNCSGKEASLSECHQGPWGEHSCDHSQDVSVECSGQVRLVNGSSHCSGRVEVLYKQHW
ncbi:deleted in malignant brain tumors 1 protein-like, partial [Sceloporus undulatus]|uniref:deleted in malignant brain tumors 1 protein-like n=1 Tax=Sceloporus undulatus TaxID=8520 RepID=UPI001C4C4D79